MLTESEMEIIDVFRKDVFRSYTMRELMKRTGRKTYTWTFNAVKKLVKMGILKIEIKGKSNICRIDIDSRLAVLYLSLLDELEAHSRKIPHLEELVYEIPVPFFTFLVGGSYAEGKHTKKSDLDVCMLVDDTADTKKITNMLENKLMIPRLHPFVFRKSEFLEMLLNKEANYGKLLFRKHLIAFGAENYYLIIKEAMDHGFRG
ncbi:MAG: nucleotidyltransferase domain-containing protein [Candidatus Aenigmarchaeota archaeon]|nr:nucleotidyltransferase domain-containing protein [Candidatus Aenigmarchaeota archaeon]